MQDKILLLFEFEKKYDLLNLKINDIYIWQYLRGEIIYQLLNQTSEKNTFFNLDKQIGVNFRKKILKIVSLTKSSIVYNPFLILKKYQKIVFLHARKSLINNNYIDIYSNDFIDDTTLVIDSSFDDKFYTNYKRNSFLNLVMFFLRMFLKHHFKKDEISKIQTELINELHLNIDLEAMFYKHLGTFKAFYLVYNILFKYIRPKEIIIVVNYGQAPLIKAAKDNKIKVIEVQHGNIDKYHYGYSYPYNKQIEYFPDELYVFGEYFRRLNFIPLPANHIKIHNYTFFREKIHRFRHIIREENVICFISDATFLGGELQNYIFNNIGFFQNFKVFYKLHPQEIVNDNYKYNDITKQLLQLNFIEIVKDEYDLYELLYKANYILSPMSTVVFEALEISCKVIIPKIGHWEIDEELQKYLYFTNKNQKLDADRLNDYFNDLKFPQKGYFINSLQDIEC